MSTHIRCKLCGDWRPLSGWCLGCARLRTAKFVERGLTVEQHEQAEALARAFGMTTQELLTGVPASELERLYREVVGDTS